VSNGPHTYGSVAPKYGDSGHFYGEVAESFTEQVLPTTPSYTPEVVASTTYTPETPNATSYTPE